MTDEANAGRARWGLQVVGAVAIVWNLMGCINFVSQMNSETVAAMPEAYRQLVESRPAWGTAAFAIAVFGGVAGGVALLLRKPLAYPLFVASLIGAVIAQLPILGMPTFPTEALIGGMMQVVVGACLVAYARRAPR